MFWYNLQVISKLNCFSEDIEPRLSRARVIGQSNTTLDLIWELDLQDAIVEITPIPADTDVQTFFANSDKTLTNLVPGTSYRLLLFPKFWDTFGDYVTIDADTKLGLGDYFTEFESDHGTFQGTLTGRCETAYASVQPTDFTLTSEVPQQINKNCDEFSWVNDRNEHFVTFYFFFSGLTPGMVANNFFIIKSSPKNHSAAFFVVMERTE